MTPSQTVGPFFHFALTADRSRGTIAGPETKGERIKVEILLFDGDGKPVDDSMIEIWQCDCDGAYDSTFCGFGRLATDDNGLCVFETIRPGRLEHDHAAHLNVSVFARGLNSRLCTRIYFADDKALATDPVLALVPEDRRSTLIATSETPGAWHLDIHLQGDRETVFFDL